MLTDRCAVPLFAVRTRCDVVQGADLVGGDVPRGNLPPNGGRWYDGTATVGGGGLVRVGGQRADGAFLAFSWTNQFMANPTLRDQEASSPRSSCDRDGRRS